MSPPLKRIFSTLPEKYICSASSEIRILYPEKYTKLPPSRTTGPFHFTQRGFLLKISHFSFFFTFWLNLKVFTRVWEGFVLFFSQRKPQMKVIHPPFRAKLLFAISIFPSFHSFFGSYISTVRHLLGNSRRVVVYRNRSSSCWRPQLQVQYEKRNFAKIVFAKS